MRSLRMVALGAVVVAASIVALPVPAWSADPVVTWPEITTWNPDTADYVISLAYEGPDTFFATHQSWRVPVNSSGSTVLRFGFEGVLHDRSNINLFRCSAVQCSLFATSPAPVDYFRSYYVELPRQPVHVGPLKLSADMPVVWNPAVAGLTRVSWDVIDDSETPSRIVVSGSTDVQVPEDHQGAHSVTVAVPPTLEPGNYLLRTRVDLVGPAGFFGSLSGGATSRLTVDATPPDVSVRMQETVFYPWPDDYRDDQFVRVGTYPEILPVDVTITGPDGALVRQWTLSDGGSFFFDGLDSNRDLLPEGLYTFTARSVDEVGNEATATDSVMLSHAHDRTRRFTRTVQAAKTVVDKAVGSCSTLASPASRGWAGSLGYYSGSKCRRASGLGVATLHALRLPAGAGNGSVRIFAFGGASRGHRGDRLQIYYLTKRGKLMTADLLPARLAWHGGLPLDGSSVVANPSRDPHVLWGMGTGGPWRYDVKAFRVKVVYSVFE